MAPKFKGLEYGRPYTLVKQEDGEEIRAAYCWTRNENAKDPRHRFVYRDSGDENIPIVMSVPHSVIKIRGTRITVTKNSKVKLNAIMPAMGVHDRRARIRHSHLIKLLEEAGL